MIEEWRPAVVVGPGPDYEVSNFGRVRRSPGSPGTRGAGHVLSQHGGKSGHLRVDIRGRSYGVHRLVLGAFVGPPPEPGMDGCHEDGDPANNHVSNLRWDTRAGNLADMIRHGTSRRFQTRCVNGHQFSPENTKTRIKGGRTVRDCITCSRERAARAYATRTRYVPPDRRDDGRCAVCLMPLPPLSRKSRKYCSKRCKAKIHNATTKGGHPHRRAA